jgi:hypothetical protein
VQALASSVKGEVILYLFLADDVPVFRRVVSGIDDQVDDVKLRVKPFQIVQVDGFELFLVVEIGLLGQGVGDVVVFIAGQDAPDGDLLRAIGLEDNEGGFMFRGDLRRLPPQRLCNEGGIEDDALVIFKSFVRLLEHHVVDLRPLFHIAGHFRVEDILVFQHLQPDEVGAQ